MEENDISKDMPECEVPAVVVNDQGQAIDRRKDYWGWLEEIRRQLSNNNKH